MRRRVPRHCGETGFVLHYWCDKLYPSCYCIMLQYYWIIGSDNRNAKHSSPTGIIRSTERKLHASTGGEWLKFGHSWTGLANALGKWWGIRKAACMSPPKGTSAEKSAGKRTMDDYLGGRKKSSRRGKRARKGTGKIFYKLKAVFSLYAMLIVPCSKLCAIRNLLGLH